MANGVVRWVMEVSGGAQVRQALRGLVNESRNADRATSASARASSTERGRLSRSLSRDLQRDVRGRVRAESDADRAILQSARETSRERGRLRRAEERDMRRALNNSRPQGHGGRGGALRAVGAAVTGVAQAAMGRVEGWSSALGAPTRDELIQRTLANQLSLIRATSGAGMSTQQSDAVFTQVQRVARSTGTDTGQLTEGLAVAQERFSALGPISDNLEQIALAARAVDAPVADMVGALGEFQRQLGVSSEEIPTLLGLMADGMNQGSLNAGDVASNFSSLMSTFTTLRGDAGRGTAGATEFLATAQALGASGAGPEGARTLMENMMSQLSRTDTQRNLEQALGDQNVFNDQGQMQVGFGELISRMANTPGMQNAAVMQDIFGNDMQGARARNFLIEQTRTTGNPIDALMGASAGRGNDFITSVNSRIDASPAGEAMRIRANAEANFAANGDELLRTMTDMVGPMSELTSQYPMATEALGFFRDAIGSVTGALGTLGLINMAGAGGGIAGALGLGGAGAGAAGAGVAGVGGAGLLGMAIPALGIGSALVGAGVMAADYRRNARERDRRSAGNAFLMNNPELATAEALANTTTQAEGAAMLEREGRRSAGAQGRRTAASNMAMFRGEASTVTLDDASVNALSQGMVRAFDRGAPAAGRTPTEPGRRQ